MRRILTADNGKVSEGGHKYIKYNTQPIEATTEAVEAVKAMEAIERRKKQFSLSINLSTDCALSTLVYIT